MEQEKKKELLMEYLLLMERLEHTCQEARRWRELSRWAETEASGSIKTTAIQLAEECEELAWRTNQARKRLRRKIDQIRSPRLRELLEALYLEGIPQEEFRARKGYSKGYFRQLRGQAIQRFPED